MCADDAQFRRKTCDILLLFTNSVNIDWSQTLLSFYPTVCFALHSLLRFTVAKYKTNLHSVDTQLILTHAWHVEWQWSHFTWIELTWKYTQLKYQIKIELKYALIAGVFRSRRAKSQLNLKQTNRSKFDIALKSREKCLLNQSHIHLFIWTSQLRIQSNNKYK